MSDLHQCPRCRSVTVRVPRRWSDKAISLLYPLKRYRCGKISCGHEIIVGNAHYMERFLHLVGKS